MVYDITPKLQNQYCLSRLIVLLFISVTFVDFYGKTNFEAACIDQILDTLWDLNSRGTKMFGRPYHRVEDKDKMVKRYIIALCKARKNIENEIEKLVQFNRISQLKDTNQERKDTRDTNTNYNTHESKKTSSFPTM